MSAVGGTSLASTLKQWLEDLLISAKIVSPRFEDYRFDSFDWYSESSSDTFDKWIENEVLKILEKEGIKKKTGKRRERKVPSVLDSLEDGLRSGAGLNFGTGMLTRIIPHAAIVALTMQVAKMVLEDLKRPGGALDIRYKRMLTNEVENYMSRQMQRDTQIGNRQVIIQMRSQFLNLKGTGSSNTFRQVKEYGDRLAEVGLNTKDTAQLLERYVGR